MASKWWNCHLLKMENSSDRHIPTDSATCHSQSWWILISQQLSGLLTLSSWAKLRWCIGIPHWQHHSILLSELNIRTHAMVGTLDIQVLECFQVKSSGKVGAMWWSCSVAYTRLIHMIYLVWYLWSLPYMFFNHPYQVLALCSMIL